MTIGALLHGSSSVPELARGLGRRCRQEPATLWRSRREEVRRRAMVTLSDRLTTALQHDPEPDLSGCATAIAACADVDSDDPFVAQAVLRALCAAVLTRWYGRHRGVLTLQHGDVYPVPARSFQTSYARSYSQDKIEKLSPLRGTGFRIWPHERPWPSVALDFALVNELDEAAFPAGRLPVCATVHPYDCLEELDRKPETTDTTFFGGGPRRVDLRLVADQLHAAAAAGATVAVLPEMSLDRSDALADLVRRRHADFPALIVAGSAHDLATRTNSSVTSFAGAPVLRHDKLYPYTWRRDGLSRDEDFEPGPGATVLVGRRTRLATPICSDLLYPPLVNRLLDAGVNLMLVPALSERIGPFQSVASRVATEQRGVTIVANGSPLPRGAPEQPFLALCGAPRDGDHVVRDDGVVSQSRRGVLRVCPETLTIRPA